MRLFDERLRIDGKRADARVEERCVGARLIRTMEGAARVELTISDPDFALLRSDVLTRPGVKRDKFKQAARARFGRARLVLDGVAFRLAAFEGTYDSNTRQAVLGFEDEVWSLLRRPKGPMKATRGRVTRAQFVARQVRAIEPRPAYVIPQLSDDQPIKGNAPEKRRKRREKGFAKRARVKIKGVLANSEQRRVLTTALTIADEERAGERATLALLVAITQESGAHNLAGGDADSIGVLQLRVGIHGREKASSVEKSVRGFLLDGYWGKGGAIEIAADNPEFTAGQIAQQVQGSAYPTAYDPWLEEAEDNLERWGGAGRVTIKDKPYEFRRLGGRRGEEDETAAQCIRRLADEVRWRAFADMNVFEYVTDEWLFQNQPVTVITPESEGVVGFGALVHVGIPDAEVPMKIRAGRWDGAPGDCVELDGFGVLDGRWLTWELDTDLLTDDTALTLRRPRPALPEPAPDRETIALTETAQLERGSTRARIVEAAKLALRHKEAFVYSMTRPYPRSLLKPTIRGLAPISEEPIVTGYEVQRLDCSSFVTLVYKYANAPDPNQSRYDGQGYTGSLWANGERTSDPQPGDLAFYGNPSAAGGDAHVNVYIGGGESINMGPSGVTRGNTKTAFRTDFAGFRTYDLD